MIKEIFVFKNGNVAVIDNKDEQMPEYQKLLSGKHIKWHIQQTVANDWQEYIN